MTQAPPIPAAVDLAADNCRLASLVELAATLADADQELPSRLGRAIEVLAELAQAERASLMLLEGEVLVVRAATNPAIIGMTTALDAASISTEVLKSGQAVYCKDVGHSNYAPVSREGDQSHYRTGSLISLPLMVAGKAVGVLNLSDKRGAPFFTDSDLAMSQNIAAQVTHQVNFSALHSRLEDAYRDLARAQKAKDELMYLIFHDMKAPLTAVKEILKLLGPAGGLGEAERELYLTMAEGDLELLWRRVTNLLDLNRIDSGDYPLRRQPVDLAQVAAESARVLAGISRVREVEIGLDLAEAPVAMADEDLVERIIVNLLCNALRHSSPEEGGGGTVRLEVGERDGRIVAAVTDSGAGVEPKLGEAIFERHASAAGRGSTGLGLYFSRRAAWLMGGDVAYENLEGGGARFTFSLPGGGGR